MIRRLESQGFDLLEITSLARDDRARLDRWWRAPRVFGGVFAAVYAGGISILIVLFIYVRTGSVVWSGIPAMLMVIVVPASYSAGLLWQQMIDRSGDAFHAFGMQCAQFRNVVSMDPRSLRTRERLASRIEVWSREATDAGVLCEAERGALITTMQKPQLGHDDLRDFGSLGRRAALSVLRGHIDLDVVGRNAVRVLGRRWRPAKGKVGHPAWLTFGPALIGAGATVAASLVALNS